MAWKFAPTGISRALAALCAVAVAAAVIGGLPASAAASYPWQNQAAMQWEKEGRLRATFIIDTNEGATIPRSLFLSQPYLGFYKGEGFDRNFFTWAPKVEVGEGYMEGRRWTGCYSGHQQAVPNGWSHCAREGVKLGSSAKPMREDVLHGGVTGFAWNQTFVSNICGNWSPASTAAKEAPMPTISGTVFQDFNANGIRNAEDTGLGGWTVKLYYKGAYVTSTTTAPDGSYSFALNADTLTANGSPIGGGEYSVEQVLQAGWHQSTPSRTISVGVGYGAGIHNFSGNDFGDWQPATISGHKYDDHDVDGIWGAPDTAIEGWAMRLSNGAETLTGAGGLYSFTVAPGTYTVSERSRAGWRRTEPSPSGPGTYTYTVRSGQTVSGADFGNVCLGGIALAPIDSSTGQPITDMEVRIEEVSVPGILANNPSLPLTGAGSFSDLLPGTYRVVAFLPEGVFTSEPETVPIEGRFAVVKEVRVPECHTAHLPIRLFTESTPGKVTGGVKIAVPGGFATSGLHFSSNGAATTGMLQYNDHVAPLTLHTEDIEAIEIAGHEEATVWGKLRAAGTVQRFHLRLIDAATPGRGQDHFELTLADGYTAGQGEPISAGNVQIHR